MKQEQTQMAIIFNGVQLSEKQIEKIENGFSQVISRELNVDPKLRNYVVIRDVQQFIPKLFPKPFPLGITIDFRHDILNKVNNGYHVQ